MVEVVKDGGANGYEFPQSAKPQKLQHRPRASSEMAGVNSPRDFLAPANVGLRAFVARIRTSPPPPTRSTREVDHECLLRSNTQRMLRDRDGAKLAFKTPAVNEHLPSIIRHRSSD